MNDCMQFIFDARVERVSVDSKPRARGFRLATLCMTGMMFLGCSGSDATNGGGVGGESNSGGSSNNGGNINSSGGLAVGGAVASGGTAASGGAQATGGVAALGGAIGSGGSPNATGGAPQVGGSQSTGGARPTGGSTSTAGGTSALGGISNTGGTVASGGSRASGGSVSTGGIRSTGGTLATAGSSATGGAFSTGGSKATTGGMPNTGGTPATGGSKSTGGAPNTGGTRTTGGTTGTAGSTSYHPCPTDGNPCKVFPFGDSITWGVGDLNNAGYRGPLFASAVAAGKTITFTGSLSNGPTTVSGQTFPQKNEGHSGWGISEVNPNSGGSVGITTVIPSPGFSSGSGGIPNIILLHIGTNDSGTYSATQMTSDLSGLLDKLITNAPDALLVVAQIIPLGYGTNSVIQAYNQSIPGLVQQRANAGKHITIVDMYTGFTTSTMISSDSVHPNTTGYKFMADHWYSVIGSLLP